MVYRCLCAWNDTHAIESAAVVDGSAAGEAAPTVDAAPGGWAVGPARAAGALEGEVLPPISACAKGRPQTRGLHRVVHGTRALPETAGDGCRATSGMLTARSSCLAPLGTELSSRSALLPWVSDCGELAGLRPWR